MAAASFRYVVDDVDAAIAFYRDELGFELVMHPAPAFAMLVLGELRLLLSAAIDGGPQPGGWNRFQLEVEDLDATVARLRERGAGFRSDEIREGVGGRQILVEDPSGNAVELFQPTIPEARMSDAAGSA